MFQTIMMMSTIKVNYKVLTEPEGENPGTVQIGDGYNCAIYNEITYDTISLPSEVINLVDGNKYTVTSIGDNAFKKCNKLSLLNLPESVTSIGNDAFYDCDGLVLSSLPENLTFIGERAFYSCEKIALTSLPDGVIFIGDNAFEGCSELALTSLPSKLNTIGVEAFSLCGKITVSSLPEGLQSIGSNAFVSSGIAVTNFPSSVTKIGNGAFVCCNRLTKLEIPVSVTEIGAGVFAECYNLTAIDIKTNITEILNYFFDNCGKLETVILPSSVERIMKYAFGRCNSLKTVTINKKEAPTVDALAFLCPTFTLNVPAEATGYDEDGWNNATIVNYYKISGKVNNWNAEPIEGVNVTLNNSKTVTTDSDGKYQFEMALKDNEAYAIEIDKTGYITGNKSGTVSGQDVLYADFIMIRNPADITVNTSENGEISIDKNKASEGDEVIFGVTANEGYSIDKVTVLDVNDNEVTVTLNDGQYSFTMPEKAVTINSTFEAIEYHIIEGGEQKVARGEEVVIKSDAPYELLDKVYINDTEVDKQNYSVMSGSTIITFKKAYLSTLEAGTYTIKTVYTNGTEVSTTITIANYYIISGKVNNWNAEPIEGVNVTLNNNRTVTTDSDGKYQFEKALEDNEDYTIEFEKTGFISESIEGTIDGQNVSDADFIMKKNPVDITVNTSESGEISIDKDKASEGDKVIFGVTANEGYSIDKVTVSDVNDNEVTVTLNDGQYSFKMPEKAVTISSTFKAIEYHIIEGGEQKVTEGEDIVIKIDAPYELLDKVYIDDIEVDKQNYSVMSGSTIITFKKAYLSTFESGTYTIKIVYTNGTEVSTTMTVEGETVSTGDNASAFSWLIVILGLMIVITGMVVMKKRRPQA